MPFCVHPVRVLPDHLAGRAADGKPDAGAAAGDPASQMVCQVLRPLLFLFIPSWVLPAGPSPTFTANAELASAQREGPLPPRRHVAMITRFIVITSGAGRAPPSVPRQHLAPISRLCLVDDYLPGLERGQRSVPAGRRSPRRSYEWPPRYSFHLSENCL